MARLKAGTTPFSAAARRSIGEDECSRIKDHVELFRTYQRADGSVPSAQAGAARSQLTAIVELLQGYARVLPSLDTCLRDLRDWLASGIDRPPRMAGLLRRGLALVADGAEDCIVAVASEIGRDGGYCLEWVYFRRCDSEPARALRADYPSQPLTLAQLVDASSGVCRVAGGLVLTTASLAGYREGMVDSVVLWLHARSAEYFQRLLRPMLEIVLAPGSLAELRAATPAQQAHMAPAKIVAHEWHHRHGPLPFASFRAVYADAISGGFEEAYTDLHAVQTLLRHAARGGPHAAVYVVAAQLTLAERLFCYPAGDRLARSAASIGGQFCLGLLLHHDLLSFDGQHIYVAPTPRLREALSQVVAGLDRLKARALAASPRNARQMLHAHVGEYSAALDAPDGMRRALFYHWLVSKLRGATAPSAIFG